MSNISLNIDHLVFERGRSFRLKFRRTTVDYICVDPDDGWFYEIRHSKKGKMPETGPWTIYKDLHGSVRMHAGSEVEGLTISYIDNGTVFFKGPDKSKKKHQSLNTLDFSTKSLLYTSEFTMKLKPK